MTGLKLKSCKLCRYGKSYPTCSKTNSRILSEYQAQICLDYSVEEPVVPIPKIVERGLQKEARGLHWYDRNPESLVKGYDSPSLAPHSVEVRWSYTVPKGRKAIVEGLFVKLIRRTTATTEQLASCHVDFIEKDGGANPAVLKAVIVTNLVGDIDKDVLEGLVMYEGDYISGATQDLSEGGTIAYMTGCKITEFEA